MSEEHLDPLDPELREAIAAAREVPRASDEMRARLRARIASAVVPPIAPVSPSSPDPAPPTSTAGGAASAAVASSVAGKLAIALLAGAALGGAGGVWIGRTTAPPTVVRVEVPIATMPTAQVEVPIAPDPALAPRVPLETLPSVPAPAIEAERPSEPTSPDRARPIALADLEAEQTIIDAARSALSRGNAEQASELLARHRARFPRGALREEREGLEVLALVRVDREEAARAAERFARRHPDSVLLPAIERALAQ